MKSIQFAPKWPRLARLSLALATLAAPVCTLAQSNEFPEVHHRGLGTGWPVDGRKASHLRSAAMALVSGETVLANPNNPGEWVSHAVLWEGTRQKSLPVPDSEGQTALPSA